MQKWIVGTLVLSKASNGVKEFRKETNMVRIMDGVVCYFLKYETSSGTEFWFLCTCNIILIGVLATLVKGFSFNCMVCCSFIHLLIFSHYHEYLVLLQVHLDQVKGPNHQSSRMITACATWLLVIC